MDAGADRVTSAGGLGADVSTFAKPATPAPLRHPAQALVAGIIAGLVWLVVILAILRAFAWQQELAERACADARQFISYGISGAPLEYGYTYDPCATSDAYAPWGGGQGW